MACLYCFDGRMFVLRRHLECIVHVGSHEFGEDVERYVWRNYDGKR